MITKKGFEKQALLRK